MAEVVLEEHTAMRPDLEGLEITKGELSNLSGVKASDVLRESTLRGYLSYIRRNEEELSRTKYL